MKEKTVSDRTRKKRRGSAQRLTKNNDFTVNISSLGSVSAWVRRFREVKNAPFLFLLYAN